MSNKTDADSLRLWIQNDEGLWSLIEEAATNTPDTAVDYVTEGLEIALGYEELTAFQLEFMPRMDSWEVRDMIAALVDEQREENEDEEWQPEGDAAERDAWMREG